MPLASQLSSCVAWQSQMTILLIPDCNHQQFAHAHRDARHHVHFICPGMHVHMRFICVQTLLSLGYIHTESDVQLKQLRCS
jgi:hypothetical protein